MGLQLSATLALVKVVDRVGRRPFALFGLAAMIVGLGAMIVGFLSEGAWWSAVAAVLGMLVFRASFSLSLGPLPYIMTSEFFPQEARATGVALSWTSNWTANFVVSLMFPVSQDYLKESLGESVGTAVIFSIYIFFSCIALCFVHRYLPETSGLDLEECSKSTASPGRSMAEISFET